MVINAAPEPDGEGDEVPGNVQAGVEHLLQQWVARWRNTTGAAVGPVEVIVYAVCATVP